MAAKAEWNLLLHLAADQLSVAADDIVKDLTASAQATSGGAVNVLIECVTPAATLTKIVGGQTEVTKLAKPVNTGDPASLVAFLRRGAELPAERTAVIIFGHGNGVADWVTTYKLGVTHSYLDALTIPELRQALVAGGLGRLDVIGFNACLMNMVEVAYELRGAGKVMIGSEYEELQAGWPYGAILQRLAASPKMQAEELGKVILEEYERKADKTETRVMAAVRLEKMGPIGGTMTAIVQRLAGQGAHVVAARQATPTIEGRNYYDLEELLKQLGKRDIDVGEGIKQLESALLHPIVNLNGDPTNHGLSLYFPDQPGDALTIPVYRDIAFAADTGWADYLKAWLAGH